jgi:hypothetical protein
VKATAAKGW